MPTYLHAIVFDREHIPDRLTETLTAFRKHTGRELADYAAEHLPPIFSEAFRREAATDRAQRFWQPSRHPISLTSRDYWEQKVNYLHDNPRRKGLVLYAEHWRFSSARFYMQGEEEYRVVEITRIEW